MAGFCHSPRATRCLAFFDRIGAPARVSAEERDRMTEGRPAEQVVSAVMGVEDCETELLFLPDGEIKPGETDD